MTLMEAVTAMQAGDESAFPVIYKETSGQAMAVIRRYCSVSTDCEDLLQDTYVQVYKYISQLKDPNGIQGWVNTIAERIAIAYLKKQKAHPQKSFSEMETEDGQLPEFEDEREDIRPELVADRKAVTEIVNQILALLSPEQRDALMMVYGQKMTIKEMAGNLGISENTIKSRLHQGKRKLMSYKADFRRLGVELPVVGIGTVLAVAFEENMAAEAAALSVSGVAFAGGEAAKETALAAGANVDGFSSAIGAAQTGAASEAATTGSVASSGAGLSTAAGAGVAASAGSAAGMAVGTKVLIGVAAAVLVVSGVAVKTMLLDSDSVMETEATVMESSAVETEAELDVAAEPTELFECFGLTADEIIAKYGEPEQHEIHDDIQVEMLIYSAEGKTFELEPDASSGAGNEEAQYRCNIIKYDSLDQIVKEKTDIHDYLEAVDGRIAAYFLLEDENDFGNDMPWCGGIGQTEIHIVSGSNTKYCFYLNDPGILDPESTDFVIAQSGDSAGTYVDYTYYNAEAKTEDFETYLAEMGYQGLKNQTTAAEGENVMDAAELAAAYYEMLQSLEDGSWNIGGLDRLQWKYADLDGDGTNEILFTSDSCNASRVGIGKIVDNKAVYCGETGGTGYVTYYPGTGKLIYGESGAGGYTSGICSLTNNRLQTDVEASYSTEYDADKNDVVVTSASGWLNGRDVAAEEAESYIEAFETKNGKGESFMYDDAGNRSYAELAALARSSGAGQTEETAASVAMSAETAVETSVANGDYIFLDSSSRALTAAEVAGLSKEQLKIARNEIFARHGYIFTTPEMKSYFESKSWYHGSIPQESFDMETVLSQVEKDNVKLIKSYE